MVLSDFEEVECGNREFWVHHGDCIEHMHEMPPQCVDFSVFSPPFPSVFAYTSEASDIGNSEDLKGEAKLHFSYFFRAIKRVLKPGRVMILHCTDIVRMKRAGGQGLAGFPDLLRRLGERAGLIYEYTWAVRKDPQAQAIRTKSHELQFAGLERDRAGSRGALPDFLLKFRAPGENAVPINSKKQVARNDWIELAEHCWSDIKETDTLNVRRSKREGDTKHICPLQLETIRRCLLLYSNPGEIVFSPFTGIGSEGYMALGGPSPVTKRRILEPRRFYGCELRLDWRNQAMENMADAVRLRKQADVSLFDSLEPVEANAEPAE